MSPMNAIAAAIIFTWLGMVIAISFIETPLKFRAPGVSLMVGLGIGRLVFRALNRAETGFAVTVMILIAYATPPPAVVSTVGVAIAALGAQLLFIRPILTARSDQVLDGARDAGADQTSPRSNAHYGYVLLELIKVAALIMGGASLLVIYT